MNLPALKDGVSCEWILARRVSVWFCDVILYRFSSHITHWAKEFSGTPKMAFSKISSQPRMFSKKFKTWITLNKVKGLTNAHCWRNLHKQMNVVRHDLKLINFELVAKRSFANDCFAIIFNPRKLETIPSILGLPNQMKAVLSDAMRKISYFHNVRLPANKELTLIRS